MSFRNRFPRKPQSLCADLSADDGGDPKLFFRKAGRKKTNRKALQLCGQVADTLSIVLAGECGDATLRDLMIVSVVPAPDSTRLLVTLAFCPSDPGTDVSEALAHLGRAYGKLRSEVAAAIHRKRAPELTFEIAAAKEGSR
jgi:ribosome-binding factor A